VAAGFCIFAGLHTDEPALLPVATHMQPGGFFKRHQDYLSLTSNAVEEYTLILGITPPEIEAATPAAGGETIVHVNPYFTLTSRATTTRGGVLLFRKDLAHEGAPLLAGQKHIVTLNVWACRKTSRHVLLVTFPPTLPPAAAAGAGGEHGAAHGTAMPAGAGGELASPAVSRAEPIAAESAVPPVGRLQALADSRSYALPAATVLFGFPASTLAAFLRSRLAALDETASPEDAGDAAAASPDAAAAAAGASAMPPVPADAPIIVYQCTRFSFEQFAPVFRVLSSMYVSPSDVEGANACGVFQHFNIGRERLLLDVAAAAEATPLSELVGAGAGDPACAAPLAADDAATVIRVDTPAATADAGDDDGEDDDDATDASTEIGGSATSGATRAAHSPAPAAGTASLRAAPAGDYAMGLGGVACAHCGRTAEQLQPGVISLRQCPACSAAWYCAPPATCAAADAALHALHCRGSIAGASSIGRAAALHSDGDIILCTSEERMRVVAEASRALDLPYVPFALVYVEGGLSFDSLEPGNCNASLDMEPAWASFGDYHAIYGVHRVVRGSSASSYASVATEIVGPTLDELVDDPDEAAMLAVPNRAVLFKRLNFYPQATSTSAHNVVSFTGWHQNAALLQLRLALHADAQLTGWERQLLAAQASIQAAERPAHGMQRRVRLPRSPFHRSLICRVLPLLIDHEDTHSAVPERCVTYPDGSPVDTTLATQVKPVPPARPHVRAQAAGAAGAHQGLLSRLLGAVGSLFDFGETTSGAVSRAPAVAAASPGSAAAPAAPIDAAAVTVVTQASGVSESATTPVVSATSASDAGATAPPAQASDLGAPAGTTPALGARMFHRNAEGKTCFSPAEAAAASAYIRDARVLTQVRSRIRHMAFQLPQQASNISATFCNESVYGRMNLVMVHGLLRLGDA